MTAIGYLARMARRTKLSRGVLKRIQTELFLRFSDRKQYIRCKFFEELERLSSFIVRNEMIGGCMTGDGDFYIKTRDGIYLYYNFRDDRYTPGDGQGLDFRSADVPTLLEDFLMRYLRDGMVFIDVGANNGYYYSLKVARRFSGCSVYCFEPDTRILYHLRKNVAYNQLGNVVVVPQALSSYCGTARMTAGLDASNFLVVDGAVSFPTVEVECTTLDDFVTRNSIARVDFMKVDVEGGEYNFLKGGKTTLESLAPIVCLELNDILLRRSEASTDLVLSFLGDLGYKCFRIKNSNDALAVPVSKMNVLGERSHCSWIESTR
jgi:FkbM family methyltransferase